MKLSNLYFVCLNYKDKTAKELSRETGINYKTIHEAARKNGVIKIPNWTEKEIDFLTIMGAKTASMYLNRSLNSCKIKYSRWINMKRIG